VRVLVAGAKAIAVCNEGLNQSMKAWLTGYVAAGPGLLYVVLLICPPGGWSGTTTSH